MTFSKSVLERKSLVVRSVARGLFDAGTKRERPESGDKIHRPLPASELARELISGDLLRFSNDLGRFGPENCSERSFHLGVDHVQVPAFIITTYLGDLRQRRVW